MITIQAKNINLSDIIPNEDNPRTILDKSVDSLIKSLQEFPEMSKLREIIVDENMVVIGGNMRLLALKKMGEHNTAAKIVTGLTASQKREFVIKDNSQFGVFDMDMLADIFSDLPLVDWGIKEFDFEADDPEKEWEGMPEFNDDGEAIKSIKVSFKIEDDIEILGKLINQDIDKDTKYIWFPRRERKTRKDKVWINES